MCVCVCVCVCIIAFCYVEVLEVISRNHSGTLSTELLTECHHDSV